MTKRSIKHMGKITVHNKYVNFITTIELIGGKKILLVKILSIWILM